MLLNSDSFLYLLKCKIVLLATSFVELDLALNALQLLCMNSILSINDFSHHPPPPNCQKFDATFSERPYTLYMWQKQLNGVIKRWDDSEIAGTLDTP